MTDWSSYQERCDFYFVANKITDSKIKRAVFLSVVGDTTYQLIRGLLSPKKLTEVHFGDIIKSLSAHYTPQKNVIVERYKFNMCNRKSGQSVTDYVAELKELSRFCDFGVTEEDATLTTQLVLEESLRDRFVCGLGESHIQRLLLSKTKLTYQKAVDLANAAEMAELGASHMTGKTSDVHKMATSPTKHKKPLNKREHTNNRNTSKQPCYRCLGAHQQETCPFKGAECFNCKKKGHISKVCKSTTRKNPGTKLTTKDTVYDLMYNMNSGVSHYPPITVNVTIRSFGIVRCCCYNKILEI